MRLSVRDELRSHTPHAIPLILLAAARLRRDTSSALRACSRFCGPISPCCRMYACSLKTLFFSLVRRMIATLINCVAEKSTSAHSGSIFSVTFSPDGTKIVSGSCDGTIIVWDSGAPQAQNRASLWPKLTPAGLSGRQTGAAEREDERPQQQHQDVGGVFPGRDQDRVWIVRQDYQSLGSGIGCAEALSKSPLLVAIN